MGAVLGLLVCIGGALAVAGWRANRSPAARVLPMLQLGSVEVPSSKRSEPISINRHVLKVLDALVSNASVERRLIAANQPVDIDRFRVEQVKWAAVGLASVVGVAILRVLGGNSVSPAFLLVACAGAAAAGAMARDFMLTRAAKTRIDAICAQLPAIAELLAFTVAAGLSVGTAIGRVAQRANGEFATELDRVCIEVAAGRPLSDALGAVADRVPAPAVQRFVDGVVTSLERGTPIAEVLRAQAMDARAEGHRELMEQAGRREITALFPVVFLILPVVVVVAVFPGFFGLVLHI